MHIFRSHTFLGALTLTTAVDTITNTGSDIPHVVTVSNTNVLVVDFDATIY